MKNSKLKACLAALETTARRGEMTTYGDLADKMGLLGPRRAQNVGPYLYLVKQQCRIRGLPPLYALCVRKDTAQPGDGYAGQGDTLDRWPSDVRRCHRRYWRGYVRFQGDK